MEQKYLLGIDQGGTKTAALLCDTDGNIVGTGLCDGLATSVYFEDTEEIYLQRIRRAAEAACAMAGISLADVSAVCGGMNGADWDFEYPVLTDGLTRALHCPDTLVVNDCIGALWGGTTAHECAIICAGTGMNIAVKRADGQQIIYGYYIPSSLQGASGIGQSALEKIMDAHIGVCEKTVLTELILNETGYASAEQLLIDITTRKTALEMKRLAPLLFQAYAHGDKEATAVVNDFCQKTAKFVIAGARRFAIQGFDLVFSGGMFKGSGILAADTIHGLVTQAGIQTRKIHARYEPVCGTALILLDKEHHGVIPPAVTQTFYTAAERHRLLR